MNYNFPRNIDASENTLYISAVFNFTTAMVTGLTIIPLVLDTMHPSLYMPFSNATTATEYLDIMQLNGGYSIWLDSWFNISFSVRRLDNTVVTWTWFLPFDIRNTTVPIVGYYDGSTMHMTISGIELTTVLTKVREYCSSCSVSTCTDGYCKNHALFVGSAP